MNAYRMTLNELNRAAFSAVRQALGLAGTVRFLRQFDTGEGDYTKERAQWLPKDLMDIGRQLKSESGKRRRKRPRSQGAG